MIMKTRGDNYIDNYCGHQHKPAICVCQKIKIRRICGSHIVRLNLCISACHKFSMQNNVENQPENMPTHIQFSAVKSRQQTEIPVLLI